MYIVELEHIVEGFPLFLFLSVAAVAVFSFVGIAAWSDARRREREAYYKNEMLKKVAESQGSGANSAVDMIREQERIAVSRRREGLRIGGLVTFASGAGVMIFLRALLPYQPVYMCGAIPLLIGVALAASSFLPSPMDR
jgi:hypothetical protein